MPAATLAAPILRASPLPSAQTARTYFAWLLSTLPRALAIEAIAWVICFAILTATLRGLRGRMKPGLMRLDDSVRAWAKTLRYQAQHPDATPETARRAALVELQAQHEVQDLDPETPPSPGLSASLTSESSSANPSLEESAQALAESIARDKTFNRPLMDDGKGNSNSDMAEPGEVMTRLDKDRDGVISHAELVTAELSSEDGQERVPLTWFFRFWTNFASAPCLSTVSLAVPLLATQRAGGVSAEALWLARTFPRTFWARALASNIAPPQLAFVAAAGLSAEALRVARVWTMPGLCFGGSMVLSYWLKKIFKRLRPQRKLGGFGHKMKDGSFPSGHSLTSFCFWTAFTLAVATSGAPAWQTVAMGAASVSIVALTGLSRVYMGVHFPSDVLGGFFIGLVWCSLSLPALRWALHLKSL